MDFFSLYWQYYLMGIILLPALILAIYAQSKVSSTYNKYAKVLSKKGVKASEMARVLLDTADLKNIKVKKISGELTDYYDHKNGVIGLSSNVHDSSSVAALGIAAHEVGHALQFKSNYLPIKIRSAIIPITTLGSSLLWPMVILGLIFNFVAIPGSILGDIFLWSGIILFGLVALLDVVTLPVEYNASNRAIKILSKTEVLDKQETEGAKKVLGAAALTYVAALLNSMLNLLRFLLVILLNRQE